MNLVPESEITERTSQRGTKAVERFFIPFTDVKDYLREFEADYEAGIVERNIVRASTYTGGRASEADIEGEWKPGGDRLNPWYVRVWVRSSYIAAGCGVHLASFCGVALTKDAPAQAWDYGRPLSEATALRVQEVHRALAVAFDKHRELDIRGGDIAVVDGAWLPEPDETIAAAPQERCATCDEPIYWSNEQWRHKATKRAEALKPGVGFQGRAIKQLDHLADPAEKGRLV